MHIFECVCASSLQTYADVDDIEVPVSVSCMTQVFSLYLNFNMENMFRFLCISYISASEI